MSSLETRRILPPTEYYAEGEEIRPNMNLELGQIEDLFTSKNYRKRSSEQKLYPGDFSLLTREECQQNLAEGLSDATDSCVLFFNREFEIVETGTPQLIAFDAGKRPIQTFVGNPLAPAERAQLNAELFAQFLGEQPIMQNYTPLGETPTQCLNAVMAIEDAKFLDHSGISLSGIGRAILRNIIRRSKQGGSTITQQMVKNYYLTSERTFRRKFKEIFMSLLLEIHATKDQILETYLNIIYLGQTGAFQVRGFSAASRHYFQKPLQELDLAECSLLAAILNSPGLYDPFSKAENATKRRSLVLEKMRDLNFITDSEFETANQEPLPKRHAASVVETAPYYLVGVNRQLKEMGIDPEGKRIFTGLRLAAQEAAQAAVIRHLDNLESKNKKIKELKEKGNRIEGTLISVDTATGLVQSLVGGRNYVVTQFNRALDGHRQIGSIMKPIVFLAALEAHVDNPERNLDPMTPLQDIRFNHKYEGQSWSPDNYGNKYFGEVPMYFALKNSLNAATASLGLQLGLDRVMDLAQRLGVQSRLEPVPSLLLGSFELYPLEVVELYTTLARMGSRISISFVQRVEDSDGRIFFQNRPQITNVVYQQSVSSLISMMKQTIQSGTAKMIFESGFDRPAAGKTGTTSDNKDAWFAGFTPNHVAVVWVGYDNNLPHSLTGASGAVPIWLDFMRSYENQFPADDFKWAEQTQIEKKKILEPDGVEREVELVFQKN